MRLRNKWIVITGGSSGIGAAIATAAGRRGNRITIVADRSEPLDVARDRISAQGIAVDAIRCDIGNAADVASLAEALLARGTPDVLINNAGFGTYRTFLSASPAEIQRLLDVNLHGHVLLTKLLCGPMASRRSGAICFMASVAGRLPITPNATYCAAKHGMVGLADALRYELATSGVEITVVCPGRVDTNFFSDETFRTRTRGPENRSAISAQRAANATVVAIESNRRMTYCPKRLQLMTWMFELAPFVTRPLYARFMKSRMERISNDARKQR